MKEILTAKEFTNKYGEEVFEKQSNASKLYMQLLDCYISYFGYTKEKAIEICFSLKEVYKSRPGYFTNKNIEIIAQEFLIEYNNKYRSLRRYSNVSSK